MTVTIALNNICRDYFLKLRNSIPILHLTTGRAYHTLTIANKYLTLIDVNIINVSKDDDELLVAKEIIIDTLEKCNILIKQHYDYIGREDGSNTFHNVMFCEIPFKHSLLYDTIINAKLADEILPPSFYTYVDHKFLSLDMTDQVS